MVLLVEVVVAVDDDVESDDYWRNGRWDKSTHGISDFSYCQAFGFATEPRGKQLTESGGSYVVSQSVNLIAGLSG